MIETTTIATNRYAPAGSNAINLYSTGAEGGDGLTIGQLAIAVSLRSAAACEAQSVIKMNSMTRGAQTLSKAAEWLDRLAGEVEPTDSEWAEIRAFAIGELGVEANALPADVSSYDRRMQAAAAMKSKMDTLSQSQQQQMIDLQTYVNRRDVAYSTSSSIVRTLAYSQSTNAQNF